MEQEYHIPVLLAESVDPIVVNPGGVYVDATFGGGGHSSYLLGRINADGRLLGFDQDQDAVANVPADSRFQFVASNFRYLKRWLRAYGIKQVDGILADLGVSSHQLNQAERGFAHRFEADLDMRMDRTEGISASDLLNTYAEEKLVEVFSKFGEVRNSKTLAGAIVSSRDTKVFKKISDLNEVLEKYSIGDKHRYYSQVYQAIRIEINDELGALEDFLKESADLLKPGGRIAVISYHSLEDRLVKNFFKTGNTSGIVSKDLYGNIDRPFRLITKKPVVPDNAEIRSNPRARSAKLRIAELSTGDDRS